MSYKIFKLKSSKEIESVMVFYGNSYGEKKYDYSEIYRKNKKSPKINEFFSEVEWDIITQKDIPIYFSELQFHIDDTMLDVKLKIVKSYHELEISFSEEEIYLFGEIKKKLSAIQIYDTLTLNRKKFITKSKLQNFLSNIILNESREPVRFEIPEKDVYDYDDIIALNVDNQYFYINTALGINTSISKVDYFFKVNPFSDIIYDDLEDKRIIHYSTSELLMNNGEIYDNRIYLCCANNVLNGNPFTSKIYFNELFKKGINSVEQLSSDWIYKSLELFSLFENKYKKIDLFYDIEKYKKIKRDLDFSCGIKSIRFNILPKSIVKLPLEVIFKIIHATIDNPFIKFNPEKSRENIYRIYCNKLSRDGRKIPFVPIGKRDTNTLANINNLNIALGKRQSVSIFINNEDSKFSSCEFFENGNIQIYCEFDPITDIETIETYIKNYINPILDEAKMYMEQNGYNIQLFNNFSEENILINGINFECNSIVEHEITQLNVTPIINYITPIFIVNNPKGSIINMRFKRVNNFNNVNSQKAFILDFYNLYEGDFDTAKDELIKLLMENFKLTLEQATQLEIDYRKEIKTLQEQKIVKRGPRKGMNPGFNVKMILTNLNNIKFNIENVDNILYLNIIPIYIQGFIKLLLNTDISFDIPDELKDEDIKEEEILDTSLKQEEEEEEVVEEVEDEDMDEDMDDIDLDDVDLDEFIQGGSEPNKSIKPIKTQLSSLSDVSLPANSDESSQQEESKSSPEETQISSSSDVSLPANSDESSQQEESKSSPEETQISSLSDVSLPANSDESSQQEESKSSPEETQISSLSDVSSIPDNLNDELQVVEKSLSKFSSPQEFKPSNTVKQESKSSDEGSQLSSLSEGSLLANSDEDTPSSKSSQQEGTPLSRLSTNSSQKQNIFLSKLGSLDNDNTSVDYNRKKISVVLPTLNPEDAYQGDDMPDLVPYISDEELLEYELQQKPKDLKEPELEESEFEQPVLEESELEESELEQPVLEESEFEQPVLEESELEQPELGERELEEEIVVPKKKIQKIIKWEGKSLTHPNPFQKKMEDNDPIIFEKDIKKGYKAYSKSCPSNQKRQPVLVTKEEMDQIIKEIPDYLEKGLKDGTILEYSSDPSKIKNYYICPRYWCLKTWSPIITEMQKKECGDPSNPNNIITEKVVPKDKFIVEFNNNGKLYPFPGFINNKDNEEQLCVPCCFSKLGDKYQDVKTKCLAKVNKLVVGKDEHKIFDAEEESKKYTLNGIKTPTFFPLYDGEYGHLPIVLKKFLQHKESGCNEVYTTTLNKIEKNKECILRVGVEKSNTQSFIACLAKYYSNNNKLEKELSIQEFKDVLIHFLTIDNFIIFQNGDLPSLFKPLIINENIQIEEYKKSKIYSKINEKNMSYFIQLVNSFENFKNYIRDPNIEIDYTYLWDIICDNNGLFNGVNLVILKIPYDDPTSNVEIICPTNHYSKSVYNPIKKTMIIFTQSVKDNIYTYYEPIYTIKNENSKKIILTPFFSVRNPYISPSIKRILIKVIAPLMSTQCKPIKSYTFKQALKLSEMVPLLVKNDYQILFQVVNYMSQVILIQVEKNTKTEIIKGVIPCFPSSVIDTYPYTFMDDETVYQSYESTILCLLNVNKEIKQIECKPIFKVVEDGKIIGVITETNQFVMVIHEVDFDDKYNIKTIEDKNLLYVDETIITNNTRDKERENSVKMIKLDTLFYNVFRNTIRILLNKYENIKLREIVEKLTKDMFIFYKDKYNTIIGILKQLGKEKITFTEIEPQEYIKFLDNYSTCATMDEKSCVSNNPLCVYTKNTCQLILPLRGAVSDNNEILFYGKMADEIIRYSRINSYIFKPNAYLSFGTLNYNLRDNEIIITETGLKDYFNHLVPVESNQYVKYNTYDNVVSNIVENEEQLKIKLSGLKDVIIGCTTFKNKKINITYWKDCFKENIMVIKYPNSVLCGFETIKTIINYNEDHDNYDIKTELADLYTYYLSKNKKQVLDILEKEGKKYYSDEIKIGNMNIVDVIFSEFYFITLFDIWLLVEKHMIPTIVLSQKILFNKQHVVTLYGKETDRFIFLITTPSRNDHVINFQILYDGINENGSENIILPLDIISCPNKSREILFTIENKKSISDFLDSYTSIKKTKYLKKFSEHLELNDDEKEEAPLVLKKPKKKLGESIIIGENIEKPLELDNPLELEKPLEPTEMLVTKKPRKPRTKKKLEEGIIIEENLDNPLETQQLVTKKPRKPRTKKKKLEEGIIIEENLDNPLETQQLVTKKPRKPRTKKLEEGIIIEDENPLQVENPLETQQLVTKKPRKPRTKKKKLDEGIIIEDEPIEEPVKSQEQQRIY
jgi:hypothetical protein